jgi:nucleotide-binding universal stress UspA family protein
MAQRARSPWPGIPRLCRRERPDLIGYQERPDLIVVGSPHAGGSRRLSSVLQGVMDGVGCAVLVV